MGCKLFDGNATVYWGGVKLPNQPDVSYELGGDMFTPVEGANSTLGYTATYKQSKFDFKLSPDAEFNMSIFNTPCNSVTVQYGNGRTINMFNAAILARPKGDGKGAYSISVGGDVRTDDETL
jgi:hypothetical protein